MPMLLIIRNGKPSVVQRDLYFQHHPCRKNSDGPLVVLWLAGCWRYYGFQANVEQTVTAQNGIRMMLSFYPAIGTLMGVGFMMIYPLNEKMMVKISSELAAWRGKKE